MNMLNWLKGMLVLSLLCLLFHLSGCSDSVNGTPAPTDPPWSPLSGKWVGTESGGTVKWTLNCLADTFSLSDGSESNTGTFTLSNGSPLQIDLGVTVSSNPFYVGKTAFGIYKIEDMTLTLVFTDPGAGVRPSSFSAFSEQGWTQRMFVLTFIPPPTSTPTSTPQPTGTPTQTPVPTSTPPPGTAWQTVSSGWSPLYGVWSANQNTTYAVGAGGTILRYDGVNWVSMMPGTSVQLNAVWGSSPTDVFAVGANGTILHYNGTTWTFIPSGATDQLNGVWGSSPTDVFAVGANGKILHYDGKSWTDMSNPAVNPLNDVWGTANNDVFAVGANGTILYYNGSMWQKIPNATNTALNEVWGTLDSVYFVGDSGTILRFTNSGGLEPQMQSGTTDQLYGIWGTSDSDVFATGTSGTIIHFDGNAWTKMLSGATEPLMDVYGNSSYDVFAVGASGSILRYYHK